jgi:hypothetical protein
VALATVWFTTVRAWPVADFVVTAAAAGRIWTFVSAGA